MCTRGGVGVKAPLPRFSMTCFPPARGTGYGGPCVDVIWSTKFDLRLFLALLKRFYPEGGEFKGQTEITP